MPGRRVRVLNQHRAQPRKLHHYYPERYARLVFLRKPAGLRPQRRRIEPAIAPARVWIKLQHRAARRVEPAFDQVIGRAPRRDRPAVQRAHRGSHDDIRLYLFRQCLVCAGLYAPTFPPADSTSAVFCLPISIFRLSTIPFGILG